MSGTIEIRNLTFRYRKDLEPVIANLTCDITCGGIIAIIGSSGIGKSTLLRLMSGVYRRSDRWIGEYDGEIRICNRMPHELRGPKQVSLMAQSPTLLDHLTIKQNILLPCQLVFENESEWSGDYQELSESLELSRMEKLRPIELSGGMKTRAALAKAMITCPQYLFLDEPFASLDLLRRWVLYKVIRQKRSNRNLTTIITTHDLWEAVILANWIIILDKENGHNRVSFIQNHVPATETCAMTECLRIIQPKVEEIAQMLDQRPAS